MKRSQAVQKIKKELNDWFTTDYKFDDYDCESILDIVESLGMLPPLSTVKAIPNELRPGTMKHTQVKHEWDEETD